MTNIDVLLSLEDRSPAANNGLQSQRAGVNDDALPPTGSKLAAGMRMG